MNFIIFSTILWTLGVVSTTVPEPNFNHPNFGVVFDPYVSIKDVGRVHSYNVNGLIPIISKVATKFRKIMLAYFGMTSNQYTYTQGLVPAAVATFNKLHRKPQQPPMELIMSFTLTVPGDGSVPTNFDLMQEVANHANPIFPGTVKRLFYMHHTLTEKLTDIQKYLTYVNRVVNHSEYILGADLILSDCGGASHTLPNYISTILPYFKEILITYYHDSEKGKSGTIETAQYFSKMFEHCVDKIEQQRRNVSVGFRTVWLGTIDEDFTQNSLHLVQYWIMMNALAIKLNKLAILTEAFDTHHRTSVFRRQGWWRLIENASYYNSSQFVYQDKFKAVEHLLAAEEIVQDDDYSGTTQSFLSRSSESVTFPTDGTTFPPESKMLLHETLPFETTTLSLPTTTSVPQDTESELKPDEDIDVKENVKPSVIPYVSIIPNPITLVVIVVSLLLLIVAVVVVGYLCKSLRQTNQGSGYDQIVFRS